MWNTQQQLVDPFVVVQLCRHDLQGDNAVAIVQTEQHEGPTDEDEQGRPCTDFASANVLLPMPSPPAPQESSDAKRLLDTLQTLVYNGAWHKIRGTSKALLYIMIVCRAQGLRNQWQNRPWEDDNAKSAEESGYEGGDDDDDSSSRVQSDSSHESNHNNQMASDSDDCAGMDIDSSEPDDGPVADVGGDEDDFDVVMDAEDDGSDLYFEEPSESFDDEFQEYDEMYDKATLVGVACTNCRTKYRLFRL